MWWVVEPETVASQVTRSAEGGMEVRGWGAGEREGVDTNVKSIGKAGIPAGGESMFFTVLQAWRGWGELPDLRGQKKTL